MKRVRRFFFGTWPHRISSTLILALLGSGVFWYNEHRAVPWSDFWSLTYWVRRYRNEDLYDPRRQMLMHGNHSLHEVALTFDDGPHLKNNSCPQILDALKRNGIHATFFDVGIRMAEYPDLLKQQLADGNEVGNHTMNHQRLPKIKASARHHEINDSDIEFYRITGKHLVYLRPPGMEYDTETLALIKRMGYMMISYDVVCGDSDLKETPEYIRDRTVNRTENGSIILLHDYAPTAAALPGIIADLKAQGYKFVTISEMIDHLPEKQRAPALAFLRAQSDTHTVAQISR